MLCGLFVMLLLFLSLVFSSPIVEGDAVSLSGSEVSFPYIVHITSEFDDFYGSCAGIILEQDVVLTAAHCIRRSARVLLGVSIKAGSYDIDVKDNDLVQETSVKGFKIHTDYVEGKRRLFLRDKVLSNDIALLWLKDNLNFTAQVQKAELPKGPVNITNQIGTIAGWGITECGWFSSVLKKTTLRGISNLECKKEYYKGLLITEKVFCAIADNRRSTAAPGDSGGPFIYEGVVIGLLSFGNDLKVERKEEESFDMCNPEYPLVYTNIYKYRTWIQESLRKGPPTKTCRKCGKYCILN